MEIIPNTSIDVRLESRCTDYSAISELMQHKGTLLNIIPRDDEESVLFNIYEAGYYWDDKYIYDDNVKVCKLNHISLQVIFNPDYEPDKIIMNICKEWEYYWKGELYDHNRIS